MNVKYWPIMPAAGVGSRMQADRPKQYLLLDGQFLLDHTLDAFLSHPAFEQLVLVLSSEDTYWPHSRFYADSRIVEAPGGRERCYSVLSGLKAIATQAKADDWVLVHDIARPCIQQADLNKLLGQTNKDGALLAVPVRDTMKRGKLQGGATVVEYSVERTQLWHALTPQMFRYQDLYRALERCLADGIEVTDEASAMEHCGYQPLLVEGQADNIKVTRPEDLALAEFFIRRKTS